MAGVQGPALLRHRHELHDAGILDGDGWPPEGVHVLGHRPELSNYDDSCRTVVDVAEKADTHIIVDPRMTNLGKEADIWLNLRPGTDGAMAMGWLNILINNELYDDLFAKKWTNGRSSCATTWSRPATRRIASRAASST